MADRSRSIQIFYRQLATGIEEGYVDGGDEIRHEIDAWLNGDLFDFEADYIKDRLEDEVGWTLIRDNGRWIVDKI